ncbi:insulin-induced protein-domain-containing protein [Annulohypoxylon bovei var. microspora]|nr:insulin-induced protein-domain-containing protein [Annulohypoxylon bovei var. microspora]
MGKRKRTDGASNKAKTSKPLTTAAVKSCSPLAIQIVAGSYDRILHGLTASISTDDEVEFADTFLFNAHNSAIRCLALSPPSAPEPGKLQKVMLASGSSDERINVYSISAHPPSRKNQDVLSSVTPRKILENPKNREIGTLLHHSSTVTKLSFPTKSKLISASEDSTIAVTRTRDWSLLSSIKTPIPMPLGRPSGDTAPLGATPAGVNDFAVHPSMKLMISVSKGERCMRLWNLMTAKKAGVLNFSRDMLQEAGEGKRSSGEGRKVVWGSTEDGDEFCVGFDRDALVFGMDSTPKCRVMPDPKRKIHELKYVTIDAANDSSLLAVSTEDGRIVFLSTKSEDLTPSKSTEGKGKTSLPTAKLIAQVGGKDAGVSGRIKDFSISRMPGKDGEDSLVIAAGSSDGKIRIFKLAVAELTEARKSKIAPTVGKLLGTYETQNRITCVEAFTMIPRPEVFTMSEFQGDSGPPLLRPIPRRPFDLHRREPTPPEDEPFVPPTNSGHSPLLNLDALNSRLLEPRNNSSAPDSASISRAQSALDITGSTLMGIYNQANFSKDKFSYLGVDEPTTPTTPWGTGAETPAKDLKFDSPHYELQKERAQPIRRRSSLHPVIRPQPLSASQRTLYLGSRGLFLSGLGVLYGILVAQLRDRRQVSGAFQMNGVLEGAYDGYDFKGMAFWGVSAVVMGSLLPWIDGIWERAFGGEDVAVESAEDHGMGGDAAEKETASSTDWPLAVRGIGAFVGIAFAIRKLPWDSTLQASLTLALVNPVLWFLIDRSMPGFLLSTTVGITGTMVVMGLKPDMVPTPANPSASTIPGYDAQYDNATSGFAQQQQQPQELISFGGVTITQEQFGTIIWVMSILFCCCVCFGNIGRWIALNRGAATRGRWAERR